MFWLMFYTAKEKINASLHVFTPETQFAQKVTSIQLNKDTHSRVVFFRSGISKTWKKISEQMTEMKNFCGPGINSTFLKQSSEQLRSKLLKICVLYQLNQWKNGTFNNIDDAFSQEKLEKEKVESFSLKKSILTKNVWKIRGS